MPIGIPKVPYQILVSSIATGLTFMTVCIASALSFLEEGVNDALANQIIAIMLYLDSDDPGKPIYLYINSPGGSVTAGLAIYDTMRHIKSEVVTICVGLAASMGAFLLCGGSKGKRLALPHARIMIHQPLGGMSGTSIRRRILILKPEKFCGYAISSTR